MHRAPAGRGAFTPSPASAVSTPLVRLVLALAALALILPASAAARPSTAYHSPGYRGLAHRPVVVPTPLPPVTLGAGKDPSVLVDAAGTGHIVFSTDGGGGAADTVSYCRLPRGQNACGATSTFAPTAPAGGASGPFEGNFAGGNHDFDGPVPLVISNQLAVVDRRFPDVFTTPGGGTDDSNVFLWTSNDGGATFTGGAQIGNNEIGGGAIVYGSSSPSIGTISRTQTGGTTFQGSGAGQYTTSQALLGPPDQDYDGSLALDGALPVAAFDDANNTTVVREWSGSGDVNNAGTWSSASFTGSSPRLAGGPGGVYVLYRDAIADGNLLVRKVSGGQPSGAPVMVAPASTSGGITDAQIAEDAAGHLVIGWIDAAGIETRTSADGVSWSTPQLIAAAPSGGGLASLALAATSDGGGFAAYVENASGAENIGTVAASAFGTQQGTGQPGINSLPGGGFGTAAGDNLATATCTDVTFGAVHAVAQAGCFLHDSTDKTGDRVVSLGTIDVNGIYLVPDAGAEIVIDPRLHTIDTIGQVSVVLRASGLPDITLWHGTLDIKLPTAAVGDSLFNLPALSQSVLEGFPIDGSIDPKLTNGGVTIQISLGLPGVFGGVTGNATLVATLSGGLQLSSLEIKVPDVVLGVAELKGLDVSYMQSGNVWEGTAELDAPAGGGGFTLKLDVKFANGQYQSGSIDTSLPPPCGVPLDPDEPPAVWLQKVGLTVALAPVSITGRATLGIVCPGDETADTGTLDGSLTASFGNPVTITVTAVGKLYGIEVESGTLVYKVPSYVNFMGKSGLDIGPFSEEGMLNLLLDPASKHFAGSLTGGITFEGVSIPSYAVAISNDGFGACLGPPYLLLPTEVSYHWGDAAPTINVSLNGCPDVTAFAPAAAAARAPRAHAAAGTTFSVAPGTKVIDLEGGRRGRPAVGRPDEPVRGAGRPEHRRQPQRARRGRVPGDAPRDDLRRDHEPGRGHMDGVPGRGLGADHAGCRWPICSRPRPCGSRCHRVGFTMW